MDEVEALVVPWQGLEPNRDSLIDAINAQSGRPGSPLLTQRRSPPRRLPLRPAGRAKADVLPPASALWTTYDTYFGRVDIFDIHAPRSGEKHLSNDIGHCIALIEEEVIKQSSDARFDCYIVILVAAEHKGLLNQLRWLRSETAKIIIMPHARVDDGGEPRIIYENTEQLPFFFRDWSMAVPPISEDLLTVSQAARDVVRDLTERADAWETLLTREPNDPIHGSTERVINEPASRPRSRPFFSRIDYIQNYRAIAKFGSLDGKASLGDLQQPLVIIHAENGVGKTSILEILYFASVRRLPNRQESLAVSANADEAVFKVYTITEGGTSGVDVHRIQRGRIGAEGDASVDFLVDFIGSGILFDEDLLAYLIDDLDRYGPFRDDVIERVLQQDLLRTTRSALDVIDRAEDAIRKRQRSHQQRMETIDEFNEILGASIELNSKFLARRLRRASSNLRDDMIDSDFLQRNKLLDAVASSSNFATLDTRVDTFFQQVLTPVKARYEELHQLGSHSRHRLPLKAMKREYEELIAELAEAKRWAEEVLAEIKLGSTGAKIDRETELLNLTAKIERCRRWTEQLEKVRLAYQDYLRHALQRAMATMAALADPATWIYRAINPGAAKNRITFGAGAAGEPFFVLTATNDEGKKTQLSTWHQLSAAQRINIALSVFLARALDPTVKGSFLMDEAFRHLDAYQRTNLLDVMRAILVRRNGEVNFIVTTADEFLLTHAVTKMRLLRRYFEPEIVPEFQDESREIRAMTSMLDARERTRAAMLLNQQARWIRGRSDRIQEGEDKDFGDYLNAWAKYTQRLAACVDDRPLGRCPVVVHHLEVTDHGELRVETFYPS